MDIKWWPRFMVLCMCIILGACSMRSESSFVSPYVEGIEPNQIATIDWSDCALVVGGTCAVSITRDTTSGPEELVPDALDFTRAELPPGQYETRLYFVREAYLDTWSSEDELTETLTESIEFQAGHHYVVNSSAWFSDTSAGAAWWIDDSTTGDLVAGHRPPKEHLDD